MVYDYILEEGENPPFNFTFRTHHDIDYYISIDLYHEKFNFPFENLYYFNFNKDPELKSTQNKRKNNIFDIKVSRTIINIIIDFLQSNKFNVLFFICDSSDNLHLCRGKLFDKWEKINTEKNYDKINLNIENSDIVMACIYNKEGYDTEIIQENIYLQLQAIQQLKS